jgi:hypothetical protein
VPAKDPNYQYTQVIILLTDGLNTEDRWYSCPTDGPCPTIDGREQTACSNIKNAGITIYTVQVNTGNDPTSTLLQDCASNTTGTLDHFFLLTSPEEIVATFNQIGTAMSNLRLARNHAAAGLPRRGTNRIPRGPRQPSVNDIP